MMYLKWTERQKENFPDESERIIALSKVWYYAKEFYPFWENIDIDWDSEYQRMVSEMLNVKDEYEYIKAIRI